MAFQLFFEDDAWLKSTSIFINLFSSTLTDISSLTLGIEFWTIVDFLTKKARLMIWMDRNKYSWILYSLKFKLLMYEILIGIIFDARLLNDFKDDNVNGDEVVVVAVAKMAAVLVLFDVVVVGLIDTDANWNQFNK